MLFEVDTVDTILKITTNLLVKKEVDWSGNRKRTLIICHSHSPNERC
jgi:hypothetical protein